MMTKEKMDASTLMSAANHLRDASEKLRTASLMANPHYKAQLIISAEEHIDIARKMIPEEAF